MFQPIFSASICGSSGFGPTLTLSYTGSTVAFVDCKHRDNLGVAPAGSWKGVIKTLFSKNEVKTPFYRITLKLPDKSKFNIFTLGGSNIGSRKEIPNNIVLQIEAMFGVDPDNICTVHLQSLKAPASTE